MKLQEIAEINYGLTLRPQDHQKGELSARLVQLRDLEEALQEVAAGGSSQMNPKYALEAHVLRMQDVLFRSRGDNPMAFMVGERSAGAYFANPLIRVRASADVLPGYLLWYLNSAAARAYYLANSRGTQMQQITITALKEMEVPDLPLVRQQAIAKLHLLSLQDATLMCQISSARQAMIQQQLAELAR